MCGANKPFIAEARGSFGIAYITAAGQVFYPVTAKIIT